MALPRVAVFKFASCDGCQLSILSLEEDLLLLAQRIDIAFFPEASSRLLDGPYDVAFVEGSISTPQHLEEIKQIRAQSAALVTIGACATSGGIQALRNGVEGGLAHQVYPHPEYLDSLHDSTPVSEHVIVDFELWGCPIDKGQLRKVLADLLAGVTPRLPGMPLCLECKRLGYPCVMVSKGEACMGPVTRTGCGAICPGMNRGCYGCFGPAELSFPAGREGPNAQALADQFEQGFKLEADEIKRKFQLIHSHAEPFKAPFLKEKSDE
jgi:coenzyme F420-reducing hydrogenase gamma subunit